eukprot:TRINITY_DN7642_c0_g1_i1.p1 TRINITY_DN7642_c0_g1~~TRINITY_DN7642_c0_g1_i1.p1  ORF type:complete len:543 (-),score=129.42 TRINITY_DN7642_c0_g1_i1:592-2220(-)
MTSRIGRVYQILHPLKLTIRSNLSKFPSKNVRISSESFGKKNTFNSSFSSLHLQASSSILSPSYSTSYIAYPSGFASISSASFHKNSEKFLVENANLNTSLRRFSTQIDKDSSKKTDEKREYAKEEHSPYFIRTINFYLGKGKIPQDEEEEAPKWRDMNEGTKYMFANAFARIGSLALFYLIVLVILVDISLFIIQHNPLTEEWINDKIGQHINDQTGLNITYDRTNFLKSAFEGKLNLTNVRIVRSNPIPPSENFCVFDMTIEKVNMKTSFLWWLRGRGFVKEIQISGVRGVVDRRTEWYDPHWRPRNWDVYWGDFWFKNVSVRDCRFTLYFPDPSQRPVAVYLYKLDTKRIRRRYLLYDLVCSKKIEAVFDGCPISYHPVKNAKKIPFLGREMMLKVNGLSVDLLSRNAEGPLGWLARGEIDFNFQVFVPPDHYNVDNISMNIYTRINRMKMDPPLSTDLSNAIAIPVARYFNKYKKSVKINSHINFPMKHFDKSWSLADAEFWDKMSIAIVESLTTMYESNKPTTWSEWWHYFWKTVKA